MLKAAGQDPQPAGVAAEFDEGAVPEQVALQAGKLCVDLAPLVQADLSPGLARTGRLRDL